MVSPMGFLSRQLSFKWLQDWKLHETWGAQTPCYGPQKCVFTFCPQVQRAGFHSVCVCMCVCAHVYLSFHIRCISSVNFLSPFVTTHIYIFLQKFKLSGGELAGTPLLSLGGSSHCLKSSVCQLGGPVAPKGFGWEARGVSSQMRVKRCVWWMDGYIEVYFSTGQDAWYSPSYKSHKMEKMRVRRGTHKTRLWPGPSGSFILVFQRSAQMSPPW